MPGVGCQKNQVPPRPGGSRIGALKHPGDFGKEALRSSQMLQHPRAEDQVEALVWKRQVLCQPGNAVYDRRPVFAQRAPVGVHANGQAHVAVQQLDQTTSATADIEHADIRSNVLPSRRLVRLPALAPAGMGRGETPAEAVLTVEIEREATPLRPPTQQMFLPRPPRPRSAGGLFSWSLPRAPEPFPPPVQASRSPLVGQRRRIQPVTLTYPVP